MKEERYSNSWTGKICLLLAAFIWGSCLVAQKSGTEYIGASTFVCLRSYIASIALIPVVLLFGREKNKDGDNTAKAGASRGYTIKGGIVCGVACSLAMLVQQIGVEYTSVGKSGFITALYILIIPLMGMIWKQYPSVKVWISVAIAVIGLYLMCMGGGFEGVNFGDVMMFLGAVLLSIHFYCIDHFVAKINPVKLSWLQFLVSGILCTPLMFIFDTISINAIIDCAIPVLYAGVCSNAMAYTLQMVGQKSVEPTKACLLMSSESIFSLLAGMVVMGEILIAREYVGCALMFIAIILSQLPDKGKNS